MGLLKNLLGSGNSQPQAAGHAPYDRCRGDEAIRATYQAAAAGQWQHLESFLAGRNDSWLVSSILTGDASDVRIETIQEWATQAPSARALSMLGWMQIRAAWAIRGNGLADTVSSQSFTSFKDGLQHAEGTLQQAVGLDPDLADPWVPLMTTSRGLQMGQKELQRRFDECQRNELFRPDACVQMLQGLCAKWGGSHEKMFEFARLIESSAAPDSPARESLPRAHYEYAAYTDGLQSADHYKTPEIAAEIEAAAERYLAATPPNPLAAHLGPLNAYVLALHPHDKRSAKLVSECIARINGRPTSSPWDMWNDEVGKKYANTSRRRLKEAARF